MKIVAGGKLEAFGDKHPQAKSPLIRWQGIVAAANWASLVEMRRTLHSADIVGPQTVFNIGGNKYRLIARVNYRVRLVVVDDVLTHSDYDKGDWKR